MKISVVTPSLDQGSFLGDTLRSVRESAALAPGVEVEHLVIDGGSRDETVTLLKAQSFAGWISEPDRGQSHAINKGFARATGDILCWLCADDLWEPDTARAVAEAFLAHPRSDVVYGDFHFLEGDSGWLRRKTAGPFSVARLLRRNFIGQPAAFWRRTVYERFGGVDEGLRYCMDHEYWLRICRETDWHYQPQPLATCRLHADAKTFGQLAPMWWESVRMGPRHGASRWLWWDALRMQIYGQHVYRLKRLLLERVGRRRSRP
jgi:glycosyltransferase involved in cell wall biosynthesis